MKQASILLFVLVISFSSFAQDWSGKTYEFNKIYPGYVVSPSGDTTRGYVEHRARTWAQKNVIFYTDASKNERKKYKPSELKGYGVADKDYRTLEIGGGPFSSKGESFVLVAKPGRVTHFVYYTEKDGANLMGKNESMADYDARINTDEILWQKLDEKPLQHQTLILGFAKKISKYLADYPELSAKVDNKDKGYGLTSIFDIMDEYNTWWAAKK